MADILGIHGYNKVNGNEELIAVMHNAPMIYNSSTTGWNKAAGVWLTANTKAQMVTFLDYLFLVNGVDPDWSYDGTTWSTTTNVADSPIARYIEKHNTRLYLGNILISGTAYRSRVWFSDLPKADGSLTWGLETGSDLAQTASSAVVTSAGSLFSTRNIKTGDPFTITNGANAGVYTVKSIDSETQITLTETLSNTATNSSFWVGGNYFDVETDDGDQIMGFGRNSNEVLIYKRNSLHRYSGIGGSLRQVKGVPGTTSRDSIVNLKEYTYYFYPQIGILRYDGVTSRIISHAIKDVIESITTANNTSVVGWSEDQRYVLFYIGDVTLRDTTSITDCVICFDTVLSVWSLRSYSQNIKAATTWLENDVPNIYVGNDSSQVLQLNTGTNFNSSAFSFEFRTLPDFPNGMGTIATFNRLRVWVENGLDVQVMFKLLYKPTTDKKQWIDDKNWRPMIGSIRGSLAEFDFPLEDVRAMGVVYKFIESSGRESFLLEKYETYTSNPSNI